MHRRRAIFDGCPEWNNGARNWLGINSGMQRPAGRLAARLLLTLMRLRGRLTTCGHSLHALRALTLLGREEVTKIPVTTVLAPRAKANNRAKKSGARIWP
jgi:hypothetical protein